MRCILDEGFAAGDTSVVDELCSPSLVEHQFGLAATGEQAREHVALRASVRDHAARMVVSVPTSGLRLASLLAAHLAAT
jgi:hypothetical protein